MHTGQKYKSTIICFCRETIETEYTLELKGTKDKTENVLRLYRYCIYLLVYIDDESDDLSGMVVDWD